MAYQQKRRPEEQVQKAPAPIDQSAQQPVKQSSPFAAPELDHAASENSISAESTNDFSSDVSSDASGNASGAASDLSVRRQQAEQASFNFADISLFPQTNGASEKTDHAQLVTQAKLTIGQPNDKYEQEADNVAADVVQQMHRPAPQPAQAKLESQSPQAEQQSNQSTDQLQQKQENESDDPQQHQSAINNSVQRTGGVTAGPASQDFETELRQAKGGGQPLDNQFREKVEPIMGADLSKVRVHDGPQADHLSQSIQAKAFTSGHDIFFKKGQYNTSTPEGQRLAVHEITHTGQQEGFDTAQRKLQEQPAVAVSSSDSQAVQRTLTVNDISENKVYRLDNASDIDTHFGEIKARLENGGVEASDHEIVDALYKMINDNTTHNSFDDFRRDIRFRINDARDQAAESTEPGFATRMFSRASNVFNHRHEKLNRRRKREAVMEGRHAKEDGRAIEQTRGQQAAALGGEVLYDAATTAAVLAADAPSGGAASITAASVGAARSAEKIRQKAKLGMGDGGMQTAQEMAVTGAQTGLGEIHPLAALITHVGELGMVVKNIVTAARSSTGEDRTLNAARIERIEARIAAAEQELPGIYDLIDDLRDNQSAREQINEIRKARDRIERGLEDAKQAVAKQKRKGQLPLINDVEQEDNRREAPAGEFTIPSYGQEEARAFEQQDDSFFGRARSFTGWGKKR